MNAAHEMCCLYSACSIICRFGEQAKNLMQQMSQNADLAVDFMPLPETQSTTYSLARNPAQVTLF